MIPPFLKAMLRPFVVQASFFAALICAVCVSEADAREISDGLSNRMEPVPDSIARRHSTDDVMLAQYADDCGCEDGDEYADDYDEDFGEDDDYAEDFGEDYDDDIEGYSHEPVAQAAGGQGLTAEQQERLNRVTDRVLRVQERATDIQVQGSYDYYGPAQ